MQRDVESLPVGVLVREARERHAWSLRELARRSAVSPAQVSRIETGATSRPDATTLARLAEALGGPGAILEFAGGLCDARAARASLEALGLASVDLPPDARGPQDLTAHQREQVRRLFLDATALAQPGGDGRGEADERDLREIARAWGALAPERRRRVLDFVDDQAVLSRRDAPPRQPAAQAGHRALAQASPPRPAAAGVTPGLRVVSWNIARRSPRKDGRLAAAVYLEALGADIALLQEAAPGRPDWPQLVMPHERIGPHRPWASAVASFGPVIEPLLEARPRAGSAPSPLLRTWPGSVAVATTPLDDGHPLALVSLYGLIDDGYAYTTLHRQFSDLTALLDSPLGDRVVVGGDLNAATQTSRRWRRLYDNLWERLALFGLVDLLAASAGSRERLADCPCDLGERCAHVHTVKLRSGRPIQADYLFASRQIADRLVACRVPDGTDGADDPFTLSDHRPIVAEFDLRPGRRHR